MDVIFTLASIKRLSFLIIVTIAAFAFQYQLSLWFTASMLLLALCLCGDTFWQRISYILLTGLLTAGLVGLTGWLSFSPILIAVYLFFITLICMWQGSRERQHFLPLLIINLFVLIAVGMPGTGAESKIRMLSLVLGTTLVVILHIICWPYFIRAELRFLLKRATKILAKWNEEIFSCYLQPDYINNIYLFERRIHVQKNKCLGIIGKCYVLIGHMKNSKHKNHWLALITQLNLLCDIIISCSLLRWRVTDTTIFSVCHQELAVLLNVMTQSLTNAKNNHTLESLEKAIKQFETTYQHVIQVAAREPLVFLLFIADLKSFAEQVELFNHTKMKAT